MTSLSRRRPLRAAVLLAAACVAVLPAASSGSTATPASPRLQAAGPGAVGATADLDRAQVSRTAAYLPQDGVVGAGPVARAHGTDGPQVRSRVRSRLFRTGLLALEPTLGVRPDGEVLAVGVSPRQAPGLRLGSKPEVASSKDRGATWQPIGPATHQATQDPFLHVDPVTGRAYTADFVGCFQISTMAQGAATWAEQPLHCGQELDHQTVFTGPPVSSAPLEDRMTYLCAIQFGAATPASFGTTCSKSTDGGTSWVPTGEPAYLSDGSYGGNYGVTGLCDGATGHGYVDAEGVLYLPKGVCGVPNLAISRDEGATWERVRIPGPEMARDERGYPDHEASVVVSGGAVHYLWVGRDRLPYLARSFDGGATWEAARKVAPAGVNETSLSAMAVHEPSGRIAIVYMGSRNSPGAPFPNDTACAASGTPQALFTGCADAGGYEDTTWDLYATVVEQPAKKKPTYLTTTFNDPRDPLTRGECGPFRCQNQYDFVDVQFAPDGAPWAVASDACTAKAEEPCAALGEMVVGTLEGLAAPRTRGPARR